MSKRVQNHPSSSSESLRDRAPRCSLQPGVKEIDEGAPSECYLDQQWFALDAIEAPETLLKDPGSEREVHVIYLIDFTKKHIRIRKWSRNDTALAQAQLSQLVWSRAAPLRCRPAGRTDCLTA